MLHVFQLRNVFWQALCLTKCGRLQRCRLHLVDDAREIAPAARVSFRKETRRFECSESNNRSQLVGHILEQEASNTLNCSLAHDGATQFEIGSVEADAGAVRELYSAGTTQPTRQTVFSHLARELVVAVKAVRFVRSFNQVVRDGWMMASVL